ncbi:uncharacterized protein LOC129915096 [Episyrphus balteatus]|uniref:uncharacterized protein LOC129915096 n=1 Tax=Episyrphus balteatus TaxID=286459 RepID=UPI0024852BD6|nr:uncharacterized protein LOC129915096 [Episyrphus balteatus]
MGKRPFNLYFTELNCSLYNEPGEEFKCWYHNIKYRTFVDGFLIMSKDVNAFQMRAKCEIIRSEGSAPMTLFDFTTDGCRLLDVASGNNILKVSLDYMRKSGHFPDRCPLVAKENYSLTNFYVDADMLPSYTPECKCNMST